MHLWSMAVFSSDSITLPANINLRVDENTSNILSHVAVQPCLSLTLLNHMLSDPTQGITFIFIKCHLLRLNALFQPVKMILNPDSVILCKSDLPELGVRSRFDNKPSLSSFKSMIKMLRGPHQGKSKAAGSPPSPECCVDLNFF